jgi:hypothetical protein
MKKILIFGFFICFCTVYSFGGDPELWTTANVGWVRENAPGTPVISRAAARTQILRYCALYRYYNYSALDFVNRGDEGQLYIYAGMLDGDVIVRFINGNESEGILFSNNTYGFSQVMNQRTIERIIDSWFW